MPRFPPENAISGAHPDVIEAQGVSGLGPNTEMTDVRLAANKSPVFWRFGKRTKSSNRLQ
jgi:hypothetical protein